MVANGLVPMGGFVCDFEDGSASFAARGMRVPHSKKKPSGGKDNFTMKTIDLFFDGLSGWSRAHNVLAPQDDPEWKGSLQEFVRPTSRVLSCLHCQQP